MEKGIVKIDPQIAEESAFKVKGSILLEKDRMFAFQGPWLSQKIIS